MTIELPQKKLVANSFDKAALTYDDVAILQRQTGDELLNLLDQQSIVPNSIVDLGAGTGRNLSLLAQRFPDASLIAIDIAKGMLKKARHTFEFDTSTDKKANYIAGDAEALPLADNSIDLIYANLALQWCDPLKSFKEVHRVLKPNGLIVFTSLGPETLHELRHAWSQVDSFTHVNAFHQIDKVQQAISAAGCEVSSIKVDQYQLTYPDAMSLMIDLKVLGARNVNQGRRPGLTGKKRLDRVEKAYEHYRIQGLLPATYQVIVGFARC